MRRLTFIAALLIATSSHAAEWNVDPLTSKLRFSAEQAGESFEGSFPKFTSVIDFDEAAPQKGSIRITIDMSKLQVEGKDRLDALPTDDWFAVSKFPIAEFTSTSIKATGADKAGANSYLAKGKLNIRGISRDIDLPFSLKTNGTSTVARGTVTLNRNDFGVGQGRWASE
ncbi:MAG: YceI family protein [Rickettsiales bacterium]|nr:YceI family protein [Rickettsiales bacterium]